MSVDRIVNFMLESARREEKRINPPEPKQPAYFTFTRKAKDLIKPAKDRAAHHHERETHYTKALEEAEKTLRSEGIKVEVIDQSTGFAMQGSLCSGNISVGNQNPSNAPKFEAKMNQDMLGAVEKAKTKMLEHRNSAIRFEKYARAFSCCPPEYEVLLTVEDVHDFQLEG